MSNSSQTLHDQVPLMPYVPVEANGILIREAVEADNDALLSLTRLTPMAGTISLRLDREPNFFALSRARGESVFFVAEDVAESNRRVIGCLSVTLLWAYIDGILERVGHANDLKVHPDYAGKRLALRLIAAGEKYLRDQGIDISFGLVAEGNSKVMRLAEGKQGQAVSLLLGRFMVNQLLPSPFLRKAIRAGVDQARPQDLAGIAHMLDANHRLRNFAPSVSLEEVQTRFTEAKGKMFVVRKQGRVIATLTVEDTQNLRQNVVIGLPWTLRIAFGFLRLLPKITVPKLGQPLRILYVRFPACEPGQEEALRLLIAVARYEAYRGGYSFLSVGLHERDPLRAALTGLRKFTFTSQAIATTLKGPERVKSLIDKIAYEDFALV